MSRSKSLRFVFLFGLGAFLFSCSFSEKEQAGSIELETKLFVLETSDGDSWVFLAPEYIPSNSRVFGEVGPTTFLFSFREVHQLNQISFYYDYQDQAVGLLDASFSLEDAELSESIRRLHSLNISFLDKKITIEETHKALRFMNFFPEEKRFRFVLALRPQADLFEPFTQFLHEPSSLKFSFLFKEDMSSLAEITLPAEVLTKLTELIEVFDWKGSLQDKLDEVT